MLNNILKLMTMRSHACCHDSRCFLSNTINCVLEWVYSRVEDQIISEIEELCWFYIKHQLIVLDKMA